MLQAIRLARLEPPHPDDLTLAATAWMHRGQFDQARALLDQALGIDPLHLLAARALGRLGPLSDSALTALRWHAETSPDAVQALADHVALSQQPIAYVGRRRVHCLLPPGEWQVSLRWRDLVLNDQSLPSSAQLRLIEMPMPDPLRGVISPSVHVNGTALPQGPIAASLLTAPRIASRGRAVNASHWAVQALDLSNPTRPVALLLSAPDGTSSRYVIAPVTGLAVTGLDDMSETIIELPAGTTRPALTAELTGEPVCLPVAGPADEIVTIIIPVHGDLPATRTCFNALLTSDPGTKMRILAIDDASPEPEISRMLDVLAAQGKIDLIRNPGNLGFVRSVNIGMARHPGSDVVLLNADTVVAPGWLGRMKVAAWRDSDTGTVTPWSNDATICSYPGLNEPTPLPDIDVAALDRTAARTLPGQTLAIPTAVGFCMYIRRDCLLDTGWFDADAFGTGYGEENDFCLRATKAGYRHLIALDVFVGHVGGGSFGPAKQARIKAALAVLEDRHPGYDQTIQAFIAADPLRIARRHLDLARLRDEGRPRPLLIVSAKLGGGTDRFINDRVGPGDKAVILRPERSPDLPVRLRLELPDRPDLTNLLYEDETELELLKADLHDMGVTEMELHHPAQMPGRLLPDIAGWFPMRAHIHDYGWICPRINLLDGDDRYCGEPDTAACETCVATHGDLLAIDMPVAQWRELSRQILESAMSVGCSSQDTARRMRRYAPAAHFRVTPAEQPASIMRPRPNRAPRQGEPLRIVVPGAIGPPKGFDILLACARDAARRDLPLYFQVLGYSMDDEALADTGRVRITGRYGEEEVLALLAELRPHAAFLPSVWPETWCYALSHMLAAGLTVAAFDMGAQAERLRMAGHGILLPAALPPGSINDALLTAFGTRP